MPAWASSVAELIGFYSVGVAMLTVALLTASRYMDRHPRRLSADRLRVVRDYTREPIPTYYDPADWEREPFA